RRRRKGRRAAAGSDRPGKGVLRSAADHARRGHRASVRRCVVRRRRELRRLRAHSGLRRAPRRSAPRPRAGRRVPDSDAEQVHERRVRDHPLAELHALPRGSLLPAFDGRAAGSPAPPRLRAPRVRHPRRERVLPQKSSHLRRVAGQRRTRNRESGSPAGVVAHESLRRGEGHPAAMTRSFAYSFVSTGTAALLLVLMSVAGRFLGEVEFGKFMFALLLGGVFETLMDFGLHQVTVRAVAREPERASALLRHTLTIKLLWATAALALLVVTPNLLRSEPALRMACYLLGGAAIFPACLL